MTAIPVAFRSNAGRYNFLGTTKLLNCYAEAQGKDAKGVLAVLPCDGTVLFSAVTDDTTLRGFIYMDDLDVIYAVYPSSVWKITSAGTATRIGVIPGSDIVEITRNQNADPEIVIRCDAGVYILQSDDIVPFTLDDDSDIISVDTIAGSTIYGIDDGRFFYSEINDASNVDPLSFYTAEQSPDKLVRVFVTSGDILLMGTRTIEPWAATGSNDDPFQLRSSSSVINKGCLAANSVVRLDNSVMWIADDGFVYRLGSPPQRISNGEVERAIRDDPNQPDIIGFSWSRGGHAFYTITGTAWSFTYDATTQSWHTRESYRATRWRHQLTLSAWGKVLIGDRDSGSIYYLDADTYTEAGNTIIWGVDSPPMKAGASGGIVDAIWLDVAVGHGTSSATDQGYDPMLMLSYSNDGGNTYCAPRNIPLGKRGAYKTRVKPRRLGRFDEQGRVWRLRKSDPVPMALTNVDVKVRPLNRH